MTLEYVKHLISLCFGGSAQLVQVFVCNQKYFYLVSQVITIVAVFLEMLAPIFHQYAMYALCFKMFLNAMTNVISGSCRAPLIAHLARDNNFSDCNAKERNQSSVLKLVAIGFGYKFLVFVHGDHQLSFFFFVFLSALKFFCQWKAMSVLQL